MHLKRCHRVEDGEMGISSHRVGVRVSAAAIALVAGAPVLAQDQGGGATSASSGQLGEIVVTAQRRDENLQDVPISITTLTSDDLSARGIGNPQDLQGLLPGVNFQPNGDLFVRVRGIGTFNLQPGVDSAVAYTLDGNFIAHPAELPTVLLDMERVEALRGPQGTLFGRNANAGAVNFVTARPRHHFEAGASVGTGNYNLFQSEVMLNVPVGAGVALRGSFASRRHGAYLDDGHNDEDQIAARLRALIEPSDNFSLIATVDYNRRKDSNIGQSECPPNAVEVACANIEWEPFDGNDEANPDDYSFVESWGAYAQMDLRLGDFGTLTWIPTYREADISYLTTPTRPFLETSTTNRMHTQELRLSSLSASALNWVVGGYYSRERFDQVTTYFWDTNPNIPMGPGDVINFFNVDYYKAESVAAFVQLTVPLTESFRVTGGIRYTDETKVSVGTANAYTGTVANPVLASIPTGANLKDDRITWKLGVEANVGPDNLLYANVSTGFKSGGVSQADPNITLPTTYGPETITAYQIGTKNRFLDGRLQINAEGFYYDYDGYQTILPSFQPSGLLYFLTINSQTARFYGGEIEVTVLATPNDQFDLSVALLNAKFTEFVVGANNFTGNEVPVAPNYTINLGYQHTFDLGGGGDITARVETQFVDDYFVDASNFPGGRQSAYMQSGANIRYNAPDQSWGLTGWIRNIENNGVFYNANPPGTRPVTIAYPYPPRTFGVTLHGKIR